MSKSAQKAVAIVGIGAVMPDAPNAAAFWQNIKDGRYSIGDVPRERWNADLYYDPDPAAPDKLYSRIGGWVRDFEWEPLKWKLPIPPKVSDLMDRTQKYAIACARAALADYGYPERRLDPERTAVILGNAMGGDNHLMTAARIYFPEYAEELSKSPVFAGLPEDDRRTIIEHMRTGIGKRFPIITEDTMPGELSNVASGRIASIFNLRGPNYVTDAACASAMAALDAAVEGLEEHHYDAVLTGGTDSNMSPNTFVKFCKIGALSGTGSRPYAEGADGFVMGEGAALFLIKRLEDAERDGDRIYAVIRALGGSSDGKGKGITAPNPIGQKLAVQRAWENAGIAPSAGDLIEGHGTSTKVGDLVEVESLSEVLIDYGVPRGSVALGSVKSNIGHLKGGAGAAGIFKAAMALHEKVLPPTVNFTKPNPGVDFHASPLRVNTELREWKPNGSGVRRAGVSAFGFGGTNFHVVMEEYLPGRLEKERKTMMAVSEKPELSGGGMSLKAPLRGALVLGADNDEALRNRLEHTLNEAKAGRAPAIAPPNEADLRAPVRVAIDYQDAADLADKIDKALTALEKNEAGRWKMLRAQGVFIGRGLRAKTAFLFTGQGSQYVNMLATLRDIEPIVADTYAEADEAMKPLLKKPLTDYIFVDENDEEAMKQAHHELKQTVITQPAVLATETAFLRLLRAYGIEPDMVMGHSLGEYGALLAAGALPFGHGLRAVSARGGAMAEAATEDNGAMAAVQASVENIERVLATVDGYVVVANNNSTKESVIGGTTKAVEAAMEALKAEGYNVIQLPVSHAFHTDIVAKAADSLVGILGAIGIEPPRIPVIANVTGEFYPPGPNVKKEMVDILAKQIASPVQFVKGLEKLYDSGARVFVELGPKRALYGFAEAVLGSRDGVTTLFTNHPRVGDVASFNHALCGLYAAGLGNGVPATAREHATAADPVSATADARMTPLTATGMPPAPIDAGVTPPTGASTGTGDRYTELGHLFAEFLDRGFEIYKGAGMDRTADTTVCVTGASIGLPGVDGVFNDNNFERILRGDQFIGTVPMDMRDAMARKGITRLVKGNGGDARFEAITDTADVLKLAGRAGRFDLAGDFGFPEDRLAALDHVTRLAIAAGIDAMRDAGIPLVMRYKTTTKGTKLPDRWMLPESMRDDTGIVFTSAFPGYDSLVQYVTAFERNRAHREKLAELEKVRATLASSSSGSLQAIDARIAGLRKEIDENPHEFDRRFLFRVLAMGHSQFAEYIGARGPNTHTEVACASGTHALTIAQDWIRTGRCRRAIVITADDVTTENLMEWFGAGFLASGAAATDEDVRDAALPFDRRRHGLLIGMGGAAFVVESARAAKERGVRPICDVLQTVTSNSAFHGTRLDVDHISDIMEKLISGAEKQWDIDRHDIARELMFVSHETYTPARGGSASAEVFALRRVFGNSINNIVIANTKGFTGHPMGVAVEDVVGMKALETGIVPPVPNHREIDPELGALNLSRGGAYPVRYALRLGAGFGSQISMALLRWVPSPDGRRPHPHDLGVHNRIADPAVWHAWLESATGIGAPELEVVKRTLRVKDNGLAAQAERPRAETQAAPPTFRASEDRREAAEPPPVSAATPAAAPPPPLDVTLAPDPTERDAVQDQVLKIVAEKTGYPADMLDLDLDLEADLGIDTVKQAEMFAAIRGAYDIPRDDNLQLRDYPTLAHTIQFVYEKRPDLRAVASAVTTPATAPADVATGGPTPASSTEVPVIAKASSDDDVTQTVLGIVSEQTGYPPDMLDLDLDLEADLGIDTVKQAEMFAAIRAAYDIPRDDNLQLRDYPTLAHTIQFVHERRPKPEGAVAAEPEATTAGDMSAHTAEASCEVPRRVPQPVLRPALDLCKATGVKLEKGKRVVVMTDRGGVGKALVSRLEKLGVQPLVIDGMPDAGGIVERITAWKQSGSIHGVYWLSALDEEPAIEVMDLDAWREATRVRVKLLYHTMRTVYEDIGETGSFLISATRLGGRHGYDARGAVAPLGGAVTGFTKSFKHEKSGALVKAVDFESSRKTAAFADILIDETLADPGVLEIGYQDGCRWTVGLADAPVEAGSGTGITLNNDTVFVITGAAGGIVSAITVDLAGASNGGTFHLLDLTPEPARDDAQVALFARDKEALKRALVDKLKSRGERVTPVMVEKELAAIERRRAALIAIEAVEKAGGTAHYHSVNMLDGDAMAAVMEKIADTSGRIDVLLHAAGLEVSKSLPKKEPAEFNLVFDVKSDGWFNLVSNLGDMPLRSVMVFSSIAGRFGNMGQPDYSAANDLLCKFVSNFRTTRPDTHAVAIDWTAWGDIGMATRGSIPQLLADAGIELLDARAGIRIVRRELTDGPGGEVLIANALGSMLDEFDETGGVDVDKLQAMAHAKGVMAQRVVGMGVHSGLVVETRLDPKEQPFLYDHQIDGTPVLPGVMGIEALVEAATLVFPDLHVGSVENIDFSSPFKFYRGEPRTVVLYATFETNKGDIVANCRLVGKRTLHGRHEPEVTTHFTARVRLVTKARKAMKAGRMKAASEDHRIESGDIYKLYFHGPAYQVVENSWRSGREIVGKFNSNLPANHAPEDVPALVAPRLIELCFQTAGLSEMAGSATMGLPHHIDEVEFLLSAQEKSKEHYYAAVTSDDKGAYEARVVDDEGNVYLALRGYRTQQLPGSIQDDLLKPFKEKMAEV